MLHWFWNIALAIGVFTVKIFLLKVVEPGLLTETLETLNVVRGLELMGICWRNVFIFVVVLEHVIEGLHRILVITEFDILLLSYLVWKHRMLLLD